MTLPIAVSEVVEIGSTERADDVYRNVDLLIRKQAESLRPDQEIHIYMPHATLYYAHIAGYLRKYFPHLRVRLPKTGQSALRIGYLDESHGMHRIKVART